MIGVNYYFNSQWIKEGRTLDWRANPPEKGWIPPHQLIADIYERYNRPIYVAETSHCGPTNVEWLYRFAEEVQKAQAMDIPIEGVCLFPVSDRPDWLRERGWHACGPIAINAESENLDRKLDGRLVAALRNVQYWLQPRFADNDNRGEKAFSVPKDPVLTAE